MKIIDDNEMGTKEVLLQRIKEIIEEYRIIEGRYNNYREINTFNIKILLTKIKSLMSNNFQDWTYNKQIEQYTYDGSLSYLINIMPHIIALYDDLSKDYAKLEKQKEISLQYEEIIEEMNLHDPTYEEVIAEINGTYNDHYFASMYIMIRKLLENLLYDCLKKYYGTGNVDKFFNTHKGHHQGISTLIDNFNYMIKEINFKSVVGDIEQQFVDLLKEFQEKGNHTAHSLFSLHHQDFIEERKDKINDLIKKLDLVLQKL